MSELPDGAPLRSFNFETMSGVFPGTRTQIYQRLRLVPIDPATSESCWALLYWYAEPPACVLVRQDPAMARLEQEPLLLLDRPAEGDLNKRLRHGLREIGWRLHACGSCVHWRRGAGVDDTSGAPATADGLTLGACALRRIEGPFQAADAVPPALQAQSHLALGCTHWLESGAPADAEAMLPVQRLPMIAETTESKLKPLARLRLRISRIVSPPPASRSLADLLAERSGVGAGTEPCAACQGRIANLGALTVSSPEGDKETFSVWRCRVCHGLYLSDWVDRWERVESLETDERIFRLAPVEAAELLTLFGTIRAGDHPEGRHERNAERDWIHAQLRDRTPLTHIIKQGR